MRPLGLSANALAKRIDVPVTRVSEIVRGNRGVTADTALRLARVFGTSPDLWLGLQAEYDLRVVRRGVGHDIASRVVPLKRLVSRYDEVGSNSRAEVRERTAGYAAQRDKTRAPDRRRLRRS